MKKFAMLLILALLVLSIGTIFAQDKEGDAEDNDDSDVVAVPTVVVLCPGHGIIRSFRLAADLLVEFNSVNGEWDVPVDVVISDTDNGYSITVGEWVLNCESTTADVARIDRSPAVGLNQAPPNPENPLGVAESQDGHLVVWGTAPANLRSCDNPECSQVAIVQPGDALVALGRNASSTWWFVQAADTRGWIWGDLVIIRGDLTGIPIVVTEGEPVVPRVYIGFTGNPLYNELTRERDVICPIQGGYEYPLLGRLSDDSWLWIEAMCVDGTTAQGWVQGSQVIIRNLGNVYVPIVGVKGP